MSVSSPPPKRAKTTESETPGTDFDEDAPLWPYPVGTLNTKWNEAELLQWRKRVNSVVRRDSDAYKIVVLDRLQEIISTSQSVNPDEFSLVRYGALSQDPERYPLMLVRTSDARWRTDRATVLVTGGVHGYETSGVKGAIMAIESIACSAELKQQFDFNFVIAPCVSPWAYEHIQRWSVNAIDVNRSFLEKDEDNSGTPIAGTPTPSRGEGRTEEAAFLMDYLICNDLRAQVTLHLDLHETTDTDRLEFEPARAARDGEILEDEPIPNGFYLIGKDTDWSNTEHHIDFYRSIFKSVEQNSGCKICADEIIVGCELFKPECTDGSVIPGLICSKSNNKPLCSNVCKQNGENKASLFFAATTEVYPDETKVVEGKKVKAVTEDDCNMAQYQAVMGALGFLRKYQLDAGK